MAEYVRLSYRINLSWPFRPSDLLFQLGELLHGAVIISKSSSIIWGFGEGKGKVEGVGRKGMGSEWSLQTCQLHITPGFKTFSSGKVKY